MGRLQRIYYNAIFGGLGGLLGWLLFGQLVDPAWDWRTQALLGGLLIGAVIGSFVVSVEALLDRSLVRYARYAAVGVLLGGIGGLIGFYVGDWINYVIVSTVGSGGVTPAVAPLIVLARGFGWMLFGLALGVGEGIAARSSRKISYGVVGGCLGGFVGGVVFAILMLILSPGDSSYVWGQAIGLIVLGACIGSFTAAVEELFKPAAVKVLRGWQEGREYPIVKPVQVLGRDEGVDILLLRDMRVEKRHAQIRWENGRFLLVNTNAPAAATLVNEEPVADAVELHDGDRIQLGNIVLKFLMRAAKQKPGPRKSSAPPIARAVGPRSG